ncbi:endonuclease/exonuclease/phosphatase family protein [Phycisphaeraceae bacterium D3-23]
MSAANPQIARALPTMLAAQLVLLFLACIIAITGCTTPRQNNAAAAAPTTPTPAGPGMDVSADNTLKIVSFNIRYPNRSDGPDYWGSRRHRVVQTLARLDPDVFGIQEAYDHQAQYLLNELSGYSMIGVGRDDGDTEGEMTAVLYRTDRFDLIDHGHVWLSDTPDVPGSVGWDAAITRMATWLVLHDHETQHDWLVVNTHFDHRGSTARTESAKLLARFIEAKREAIGGDLPAVLMGDFNSAIDSPPYNALMGSDGGPRLFDSYLVAAQRAPLEPGSGEGTFNGFRSRTNGARIDWVLVTPNVIVEEAGIDRVQVDGRNPSDHDPVWAVLRRE